MSLFQKRHYEWLAECLREQDATAQTIVAFSDALAHDNPKFNRVKFEDACELASVKEVRGVPLLYRKRVGAI